MDFNEIERGPGVWHLNMEVLRDNRYRIEMENLILDSLEEINLYKDFVGLWWDNLKYEIKKYTITYCKRMRKEKIKFE